MKILLSAEDLRHAPHFDKAGDKFVAKGPLTRAQLLEAAMVIAGPTLLKYKPPYVHAESFEAGDPPPNLACCERPAWRETPYLVKWLQMHYSLLRVEAVVAVFYGWRNLIEVVEFGTGSPDRVPVFPDQIVRRAVEVQAAQVILVHNHPEFEPEPSTLDIETTDTIGYGLAACSVKLIDHWILGLTEWSSMKDLDLLRDYQQEFRCMADRGRAAAN